MDCAKMGNQPAPLLLSICRRPAPCARELGGETEQPLLETAALWQGELGSKFAPTLSPSPGGARMWQPNPRANRCEEERAPACSRTLFFFLT